MLAFRDWLRSHDDERDLYLRTKRELAARHWVYVQDYADAKSEVVEAIIARALAGALTSSAPIDTVRTTDMSHTFYFRCPA